MLQSLSPRLVFFGLALAAVGCMLFAKLYLEAVLGLAACPLCMTQRVFVVLWGLIALLAALHNPGQWGRRIYAALCALAAFTGGAVAAHHVWLQHLPADQVPACGPSLEYMLQAFPLNETIREVLTGSGECAKVDWGLLGFSMPEWTLLLFVVLGVVGVIGNWRLRS